MARLHNKGKSKPSSIYHLSYEQYTKLTHIKIVQQTQLLNNFILVRITPLEVMFKLVNIYIVFNHRKFFCPTFN